MTFIRIAMACAMVAIAAPSLATAQSSSSSSASASPRDVIEANINARMRIAQSTLGDAFTELKGGDKVKGCTDLKSGADDLTAVNDLLTQDLALIKVDPSFDDTQRAAMLSKGEDAQTKLNATRDKLNQTIQTVCAAQ
jgi:hypothetical protein